MLVSVITPTFNSAATIHDTLKSVAQQQWNQVEHIIIDGGSKDETLAIVRQYPHVSKCISEKDAGLFDAMNKGIELATGEVVAILNSDDFYTNSEVISKMVQLFMNQEVDAAYADLVYVNPQNTHKNVRYWKSGPFHPRKFYNGWMPPHPTFFVRRKVYEQFGNFNIQLRNSADYEFMLRLLLKHKIPVAYLPEVTVEMRTGGMSNSSFNSRLRANQEDRKAWKLNDLKPDFHTIYSKPLRKISQFIFK